MVWYVADWHVGLRLPLLLYISAYSLRLGVARIADMVCPLHRTTYKQVTPEKALSIDWSEAEIQDAFIYEVLSQSPAMLHGQEMSIALFWTQPQCPNVEYLCRVQEPSSGGGPGGSSSIEHPCKRA